MNSSSKLDVSIADAYHQHVTSSTHVPHESEMVRVTHDRRLERRLELLLPQLLEINMTRKEGMTPNVLGSPDT